MVTHYRLHVRKIMYSGLPTTHCDPGHLLQWTWMQTHSSREPKHLIHNMYSTRYSTRFMLICRVLGDCWDCWLEINPNQQTAHALAQAGCNFLFSFSFGIFHSWSHSCNHVWVTEIRRSWVVSDSKNDLSWTKVCTTNHLLMYPPRSPR